MKRSTAFKSSYHEKFRQSFHPTLKLPTSFLTTKDRSEDRPTKLYAKYRQRRPMKEREMMYIKILLILSIYCVVQASQQPQVVINNHDVNVQQKMNVNNETNLNDLPTQKIIEHMMSDPKNKVIRNFAQLPGRTKLSVLKEMDIWQYHRFLCAFTDDQWFDMWQKLPKEEQNWIPSTRFAHLKEIRDSWCNWDNGFTRYTKNRPENVAREISLCCNKAIKNIEQNRIYNGISYEEQRNFYFKKLGQRFNIKKLRMFKEFNDNKQQKG